MKSFSIAEDKTPLNKRTFHDLLRVNVVYDNGNVGVAFLLRATVELMEFERDHIGKVMFEKDFAEYKDLVGLSYDAEHFYDEAD